nr:unnamed protein product [Digitaria exilis]
MDKIGSSRRRSRRRHGHAAAAAAAAFSTLLVTLLLCSSPAMALTPDGEALLELKLAFNATTQRLTSWRPSDPNPCAWEGISCSVPDLRVQSINLPYMQLGGIISPSIGRLDKLQRLALHQNSLHGPIPAEIKNCSELRAIYLRANYLQGGIPSEIGELVHLTILDLSSNLLRGTIPASIGSLTHLRFLNLSTNFFSGEIPNVGVLGTFKSSSFVGNLELCGLPIQRACRAKLVTYQWNLPYSTSEIIRRLELLDEEDVVGCGGFGTVYKMVMDDGTSFAVKRIDLSRESRDRTFEKELEILGSIRHINLVNLRGYCRLPTAKLLIYDFVELGSLDCYLHGDEQEDQPLNWNARMKIALGSARGLAYLHDDCSPGIVHRDIKASNILLDRSLEPRVSDFGLARLLVDNGAHVTTVVAGTFGYLAPAVGNDQMVTTEILLQLNTLTGEHRLEDIIDERCGDVEVEAVEAILDIAAMCTDADPGQRPSMSAVLKMLEEEILSPCMSELCYEQHLEL